MQLEYKEKRDEWGSNSLERSIEVGFDLDAENRQMCIHLGETCVNFLDSDST